MKAWEVKKNDIVKVNGDIKIAKTFQYLSSSSKNEGCVICGREIEVKIHQLCRRHYKQLSSNGLTPTGYNEYVKIGFYEDEEVVFPSQVELQILTG